MAASKAITVVLITAMFALAWGQVPASEPASAFEPSAAEAPSSDCINNLMNASDCLSYVTTGSKVTKPDKGCCPELAGMVESSPVCLCYLFDKKKLGSYGISIDQSRALKLPSVCGISTPSASLCPGVPVGSPTGSEVSPGSAPEGSALSPIPGSKAWNDGVSVSTLASLLALAIAFQFPTFSLSFFALQPY